jgi:hypothetical protein
MYDFRLTYAVWPLRSAVYNLLMEILVHISRLGIRKLILGTDSYSQTIESIICSHTELKVNENHSIFLEYSSQLYIVNKS